MQETPDGTASEGPLRKCVDRILGAVYTYVSHNALLHPSQTGPPVLHLLPSPALLMPGLDLHNAKLYMPKLSIEYRLGYQVAYQGSTETSTGQQPDWGLEPKVKMLCQYS